MRAILFVTSLYVWPIAAAVVLGTLPAFAAWWLWSRGRLAWRRLRALKAVRLAGEVKP